MKKYLIDFSKLVLLAVIVGLAVTLFQYIGHEIVHFSDELAHNPNITWYFIIAGFIFIIIFMMYINKKFPGYYGSGVPQFEAYHAGWYNFDWLKMLILVTVNSLLAFFTGFLLGSEGPSISIGGSIGMGVNKLYKKEDKEIVAIGASTGFACAFMSPLAGLSHLFEENKKIINLKMFLKGILVITIAFTVSYLIFPHSLLPSFESKMLPIKYYLLLFIMIALVIFFGRLFITLTIKIKDLTKGKKLLFYSTPTLLVLFMLLKRFFPILVGSGSSAINLNVLDYSLLIILGVFTFRLVFTALSLNSNISGGLVLPALALGTLISVIVVKIGVLIDSNIINYASIFIVCGMFLSFAIITNAPLTGFILGLKYAPVKVIIIPIAITMACSYLTYKLLKLENIYHKLEKRINGYKPH